MSVSYDVSLVKTRYLWPQKKYICTILTLINQVPGLPCVSQGTVIYFFHFGVCVSLLSTLRLLLFICWLCSSLSMFFAFCFRVFSLDLCTISGFLFCFLWSLFFWSIGRFLDMSLFVPIFVSCVLYGHPLPSSSACFVVGLGLWSSFGTFSFWVFAS